MAKTLKCSKCDRKFSMPAHLARHMSSIHGRKKAKVAKKPVGRPKGVKVKAARRAKRSPARAVAGFGEGAIRLLDDMRAVHGELLTERRALDGQLAAVARAMEVLGGVAHAKKVVRRTYKKKLGRPAGKKGVRAGSLKDYIGRVFQQTTKPLGPQELGERVIKAGLKTKAKDITKAVSNTLPQMKGIKKVGFGKYTLPRK